MISTFIRYALHISIKNISFMSDPKPSENINLLVHRGHVFAFPVTDTRKCAARVRDSATGC